MKKKQYLGQQRLALADAVRCYAMVSLSP